MSTKQQLVTVTMPVDVAEALKSLAGLTIRPAKSSTTAKGARQSAQKLLTAYRLEKKGGARKVTANGDPIKYGYNPKSKEVFVGSQSHKLSIEGGYYATNSGSKTWLELTEEAFSKE
jgi:hypothetical protein